jgi:hypothetical protein
MNRANRFLLLFRKLAAAAARDQSACRGGNGRGDIGAENGHRTDNAEGDDNQQQSILCSRRTFLFPHKLTNYVQHGIHLSFE